MTVEQAFPSGAFVVSAFVRDGNGTEFLHTERYFDYTKDEALALFAESLRELGLTPTDDD
jgi:hypothetical protein